MASTDLTQRQPSVKKLQKRSAPLNRLPSSQIPARLRYGEDAQEDVTAPVRGRGAPSQYMNQSIFGMIAAAGSRTDFNKRFDESSDSEGEILEEQNAEQSRRSAESAVSPVQPAEDTIHASEDEQDKTKKKRISFQKITSSVPKLSLRKSKTRHRPSSPNHESPVSEESEDSSRSDPRDAPMMSRLLTAEAQFEANSEVETTGQISQKNLEKVRSRAESSPATLLATRLMEIFGFERPETVIAEYPCWLLQSVLLQGYLYLTRHHICFYAYLPKKSNTPAKTGYLSKRGRQNPKYRRYWFELKGDVLSYYSNPSDRYFPQGNIDLRYGISAALSTTEKDKQGDCKDFSVTTDQRTYYFRADSSMSAKEWVKTLQKTIFRSHNDGDSVKISLPVENVIDVEESPVVDFAETIKIRVIESDDSYAIDEYFFSFFSFGKDVLNTLSSIVDDRPGRRVSQELSAPRNQEISALPLRQRPSDIASGSPRDSSPISPIRETVKATLTPYAVGRDGKMAPRMSGEFSRSSISPARPSIDATENYGRSSFDRDRRSQSVDRLEAGGDRRPARSPLTQPPQDSNDSYVASSIDKETDSSIPAMSPSVEARMSASQILTRSDVFHSPGVRRMSTLLSASADDDDRRSSDEGTAPLGSDRAETGSKPIDIRPAHDRKAALQNDAGGSPGETGLRIPRTASPTLQDIVKAGSYPLQRAGAFAGYLKNRSGRMSRLLATESMSYLEKVSGMWAGSRRHYGENEGVVPDDRDVDPEDEEANVGHGDRFRAHFALPTTEKLQATYFGYLHRVLPLYGKIYISNNKFCFRSLLPGTRTKLILPLKDVENVDKEKGFRFSYHGLVLVIRGHEELFFEFSSVENRDDCTVTLLHSLESVRYLAESGILAQQDVEAAEAAKVEHKLLQEARKDSGAVDLDTALPETTETIYNDKDVPPILFDDGKASIINFKPGSALRITCLTIGSRGDVQPYIALCKGLLEDGHKPRIATHTEFGPWIEKHGIEFVPVEGDPAELMRICIENGMFTYSFLREATSKFRSWIDDLLTSAWNACQDSDILIESPSAMAGIHIAEALGIPYFRAFTMPWTRTRAYPHAFAVPEHKYGGAYNYLSYVMFDNVFWKGIAGQINRWRKRDLGLGSTNLEKLQQNKVPFLYNYSPHVVVPPLDYSDWVRVTGYWFLDEGEEFEPPTPLLAFIEKARADSKKLVYIGFGSIVVSDPTALTKTVVDAVLKADVRCILAKGWSDRLGDPSAQKSEVPLPPDIIQIKAAPHDWLFRQIDAAVHHGGAGTTGASLRAGIPTVVKPFFGDQFFFGSRIEDLGVGICLKKINVSVLARALWEAVHSERMIVKARLLGEQIRRENGVQTAIQSIYRDLEYARTLVKARNLRDLNPISLDGSPFTSMAGTPGSPGLATTRMNSIDDEDDEEEAWTFVDKSDSTRHIRKLSAMKEMQAGSRRAGEVCRTLGITETKDEALTTLRQHVRSPDPSPRVDCV